MPDIEPLPFRLRVPGEDTVDYRGARSISWRIEGLLHLEGDMLVFEWSGVRKEDRAGVGGVKSVQEELPHEVQNVPVEWISEVTMGGIWVLPSLILRARRLDAFEGVPSARPGYLRLRLRRRDVDCARAMLRAIREATELDVFGGRASNSDPRLGRGET
ncbi:MAG: hypothetical protein AB7I33_16845 [Gemmatimonadales bacterium]